MDKFTFILPLQKSLDGQQLIGTASATSVDRDDERMSKEALDMMTNDINRFNVNLFGNHEHNWENIMGGINYASNDGQKMDIKINLDNPTTNPKIPMLLNKMKVPGVKLGLSVGGNVMGYSWEYNKDLGKKIKVLDKVKIYEVSVVGIASNADSFLTIPQAIAKSVKDSVKWEDVKAKCPLCFSEIAKSICDICFYGG